MGKKIVAGVLFVLLVVGLAGGAMLLTRQHYKELYGTWEGEFSCPEEDVQTILEDFGFFPEEIELVDLASLHFVQQAEFREDGTYRFTVVAETARERTADFFRGVMDTLFENRQSLNQVYGASFQEMNQEQFRQYYAQLYQMEDYDALIAALADQAFDYKALEDYEHGEYKFQWQAINFVNSSVGEEGMAKFRIVGDTLTIEYEDEPVEYTRVK